MPGHRHLLAVSPRACPTREARKAKGRKKIRRGAGPLASRCGQGIPITRDRSPDHHAESGVGGPLRTFGPGRNRRYGVGRRPIGQWLAAHSHRHHHYGGHADRALAVEMTVGDIERAAELDFGNLARLTSRMLVSVLVMPEMPGPRAGFVLAVSGHGRPTELERQEHQQEDRQPTTHRPDFISRLQSALRVKRWHVQAVQCSAQTAAYNGARPTSAKITF